ncbi:MAG: trypsin-like peptidase domain-containing protein [Oscillospiraceae bacterium]|nr:trypsin-like peptidase domain-containing protein [Oscillospiraceae bacterium]
MMYNEKDQVFFENRSAYEKEVGATGQQAVVAANTEFTHNAGFYNTSAVGLTEIPKRRAKKRRPAMRAAAAVILCMMLMLGSGYVGAIITEGRNNSTLPVGIESTQAYSPVADSIGSSSSGNAEKSNNKNDISDIDVGNSGVINDISDSEYSLNPLGSVNPNGKTLSLTELFAGANPAVVAISTETTGRNAFGRTVTLPAAGSGFIISEDGYIATNNHVIENASSISVLLHDGKDYPAELVGRDPESDLAVLKIDAKNLSYLTWGDSDALQVGEQVAAIGNPLGEFANSMTVGYISALDREINIDGTPRNMLQTDAAVNSGNSGGPLLNLKGQVIGIVSAKSSGMDVEGLGFAIPSSKASGIVSQLIQNGYVKGRAIMGVMVATEQEDNDRTSVYIESVNSGGAAEKAGIKADDVVLSANGVAVSTVEELKDVINALSPGDKLALKILRGNTEMSITVILDEYKPAEQESYDPYYGGQFPDDDSGYSRGPWSFFPDMDSMFPQGEGN